MVKLDPPCLRFGAMARDGCDDEELKVVGFGVGRIPCRGEWRKRVR